jgi:hypothetical protein
MVSQDEFVDMNLPVAILHANTFGVRAATRTDRADVHLSGFGSYEDLSGSKYQGDWKDGVMHGQGICDTAEGEREFCCSHAAPRMQTL